MGLNAIKEKAQELLEQGQDQFRAFWSKLNKREQMILGGVSGLVGVLLIFYILKNLGGFISGSQFDTSSTLTDVSAIQRLLDERRVLRRDARSYERIMGRQNQDFDLQSHAEQKAQSFGIKLKSIKPTRVKSALADSTDSLYEVTMDPGVTLGDAMKFLESLEEPIGVRILSLEMKTNFEDRSKLDIKATLASKKSS